LLTLWLHCKVLFAAVSAGCYILHNNGWCV